MRAKARRKIEATTSWPVFAILRCAWIRWTRRRRNWKNAAGNFLKRHVRRRAADGFYFLRIAKGIYFTSPSVPKIGSRKQSFFLRADEENRDVRAMADFVDGAAVKNVAEKAVAVAGHGYQLAIFLLGDLDNFRRWISERQCCGNGESLLAQMSGGLFQIRPVAFHFFGF